MSQNQDEKTPVAVSSGSPKGTTIFLLLVIGFLFGFSTGIYVKDSVFQAYFKIVNKAVKSNDSDVDAEPVREISDAADAKPVADPAEKPAEGEEDKKTDEEKKADEEKKTEASPPNPFDTPAAKP